MRRREFLKTALWAAAAALLPGLRAAASTGRLRIALLHLAPVPGDLAGNRLLVETAVDAAADHGAGWILTPELCVCGYAFADLIGTDWIRPQPDAWVQALCRRAAQRNATLFLAHPEKDRRTAKLHNTVFVIGPDGRIRGRHRKIQTLKVGSEAWSSPGSRVRPIPAAPFGKVGVLICADAYPDWIAKRLKDDGAQILASAAAWAPGLYGPDGEWERCSKDTGLPLLVCNRTGVDGTLDFTRAESVVAIGGRRRLSLSSAASAVFLIDWDMALQAPACRSPQVIHL
jgi:predicted amidohydrolase